MRVKDKHATQLCEMARAVNVVWNYCNELSAKVFDRERRFVKAAELQHFMAGASKEGLAVGSAVFQEVAEVYCKSRLQARRVKLAWRKSGGARRSLGWIPFKARAVKYRGGQLHFQGLDLSVWDSWGLGMYELRSGAFSEDARGRWYLNVAVKVEVPLRVAPLSSAAVGVDLGLKDLASLSDGTKLENARFFSGLEEALALSQRARNKKRIRAIHAKVANRRRDYLHKLSTRLTREHGVVCVGDVNAKALARGPLGKCVLDAGWGALRTMLRYKCDDAAAWFVQVPEAGTTRVCSACGAATGPEGLGGLAVRRWTCASCGADHDRDTNAARNILIRGLAILDQEFAAAVEATAYEAAVNEIDEHLLGVLPVGVGHGPLAAGIPGRSAGEDVNVDQPLPKS